MHAPNDRFVIGTHLPLDADLLVITVDDNGQALGPGQRAVEHYPALAEALRAGTSKEPLLELPEGLHAIVVHADPEAIAADGGLAVTGRLLSGFENFGRAHGDEPPLVTLWIALGGLGDSGLSDIVSSAVLDALDRSDLPRSAHVERINIDSDEPESEVLDRLKETIARRWPESARTAQGEEASTTTDSSASVPFPDGTGIHSDSLVYGATRRDALDTRAEAAVFARVLARRDLSTPLSIGLFGSWGSGKSFFMDMIREEMEQVLTVEASGNVGRVVHIPFNAWHFADTNPWASLAVRVFDTLAAELTGHNGAPQDLEREKKELRKTLYSSREARGRAQARLRLAEERRAEISQDLELKRSSRKALARQWAIASFDAFSAELPFRGEISHVRATADRMDVDDTMDTIEDAARMARDLVDAHSRLGGLVGYLVSRFNGPLRFLFTTVLLLLLGAAVSLIPDGLNALGDYLPEQLEALSANGWVEALLMGSLGIGALLANFGMHSRRVRGSIRILEGLRDRFEAVGPHNPKIDELEAKIERLDAEIASHQEAIEAAGQRVTLAQRALQHIQDGELVYALDSQQTGCLDGTGEQGIISTVRNDFMHLKELLDTWTAKGGRGQPVDRIVVYIDDLDRCPKAQMVEVLHAIHLLMAMPLFVVVVGADPRWLERALAQTDGAHAPDDPDDHGASAPEPRSATRPSDARQFLEKIFHIPYAIGGLEDEGFRKLIDHLVHEPTVTGPAEPLQRDPDPMDEILERELSAIAREPGERERKPGLFSRMFGGGDRAGKDDDARVGGRVDPTLAGDADALLAGGPDARSAPEPMAPTRHAAAGTSPLAPWEIALMGHLGPLIATPRAAKRLLNLYLLIRVRAARDDEHFNRFIARETGHYRAVLPLLGLALCAPGYAPKLLGALARTGDEDGWDQDGGDNKTGTGETIDLVSFLAEHAPALAERMRSVTRTLAEDGKLEEISLPGNIADYAPWAPAVGRFSFHWHQDPDMARTPSSTDQGV
ncbi:MAG: P-loop NTPase fold protein [Gammaproteobacteria bacterium]